MRLRSTFTAVILLIASASLVAACSVPVFRYALEHWRPDSYVATVFHKGLTEEQKQSIDVMRAVDTLGNPAANVSVNLIDVNGPLDAAAKTLWTEHQTEELPRLIVQTPARKGPGQTIWQGDIAPSNIALLMNSPVRSEISKRLIDGASVVWVLLECGREEEDNAAFEMLSSESLRLEKTLKLPEIDEADLNDLSVAPDALKIGFSAVRVSKNDPEERAFVEMLLRVEPDLMDADINSQPMAFPIFGRGRALYALVGKGIVPDVIEEACQFLCGACQCTVKAQNPGVDLIMNVNWDNVVVPTKPLDDELPPLAGFTGFASADDSKTSDPTPDAASDSDVVLAAVDTSSEPAAGSDPSRTQTPNADAELTSSSSDPATQSRQDLVAEPSAAMGKNVLLLLIVLGIGVVIAALFLAPRGS